ncbi:phosphoethanolamine transferase [uncultured Prevotella sp.]|uniref:phosphoethanolamine transferase n=1 Tax=uncultured Prevotella sp. TaxID=159272 RepID=UPI0025E39D16|nr:phosphoethanolamine transferase [uncultured Prevotella sp.]
MKILNQAGRVFTNIFKPIRGNAAFFVFMYVLGIVCTYAVVPDKRGYHAWPLAPYELFFDVSILCVVLWLLPYKISLWAKRVIYFLFYLLVVVDVYCFVKFDTTITPTMLLLVGETDSREATEFLESYLTPDVVFSRLGWVLLVMVVHIIWAQVWRNRKKCLAWIKAKCNFDLKNAVRWHLAEPWLGLIMLVLFVVSAANCIADKAAFLRLMSYDNIGQVEHELTKKEKAQLYLPGYRLMFSIYANELTAKQVNKLVDNIDKAKVDSCSFRSRNIVLIIGESYNRHHAGLYGYDKNTTPRQARRAQKGELIPFSDVVAPWNLTSFVFKYLFSLYTVGDKGEWCDYPLFPELFRKAGYHVTFLTNQFLPQAKEAVYDFSGGFFLNNPLLSSAMFDTRNTRLYRYDAGLLADYDRLRNQNRDNNLIIFHLKGQHVDYRTRFPLDHRHFNPEDYDRPDLKEKELRVLADYDNAILYNDSIVDQIIKRFEDEDAIVVYVPDHGEECYEGDVHFYGRMHSTEITARLAREEFDIPFWIWCSHKYMVGHPSLFNDIVKSKNRRYMTDALPHLLLYLAGIQTPYYRSDLNVIGDEYNENRPRILKNTTDYDKLDVKD